MSGYQGDNLLKKSDNMDWWKGVDVKNLEGKTVHIDTLHDALEDMVCQPPRPVDKPLRMPVSGIYKIKGCGDVITGRLEQGTTKPGDEVIVTNQDHEANVGAWRRLADHGMIVKEWQINNDTAELEIDDLKALLSEKTKIVAVTHCSNIVGSINDLKSIAELVHQYDAYIVGDGVSYAPHGFPDVKSLDVDFYAFSLYKTYGPHLGLLYGKKEILNQLPNQNHEFLEGDVPYTLNPGGPNHEELSCLVGVYEYFMNLFEHHYPGENLPIREKIHKVNELIAEHEKEIANPLLDYLSNRSDIRLIGKKTITDKDRAPTIAFTMKNKSSKDLSSELVKHGIATRNDNFYAWRCLMSLGIDVDDGVVRTSMVHYNTHDDVSNLIKALKQI